MREFIAQIQDQYSSFWRRLRNGVVRFRYRLALRVAAIIAGVALVVVQPIPAAAAANDPAPAPITQEHQAQDPQLEAPKESQGDPQAGVEHQAAAPPVPHPGAPRLALDVAGALAPYEGYNFRASAEYHVRYENAVMTHPSGQREDVVVGIYLLVDKLGFGLKLQGWQTTEYEYQARLRMAVFSRRPDLPAGWDTLRITNSWVFHQLPALQSVSWAPPSHYDYELPDDKLTAIKDRLPTARRFGRFALERAMRDDGLQLVFDRPEAPVMI